MVLPQKKGAISVSAKETSAIKELIHATERERQIARRWQMIYEHHITPTSFWSKERQLVNCNTAFAQLFGLSNKREFLDRFNELSPMHQPCGTLSTEKAIMVIDKAFREGSVTLEWMHHTLEDEQPMPCEVTLKRIELKDTTIVACFMQDLRPIREARARLLEISGRTRLMLHSTPMAVSFFNENLRVLECNPESLKLFGFTGRREYLKSFFSCIPSTQPDGSPSQDVLRDIFKEAINSGITCADFLFLDKSGSAIPVELTCVREHSERSPLIIVYFKDLRELRNLTSTPNDTTNFATEVGPVPLYNKRDIPKELLGAFYRDASKIYSDLANIIEIPELDNDLIRLFTIHARAIKVALFCVGEDSLSEMARILEGAGRENDIAAIKAEAHYFLTSLKGLIDACAPEMVVKNATDSDFRLLSSKLIEIQKACTDYNKKEAKNALQELQQNTWSSHITSLLNSISVLLLHSDFEEAADLARQSLI